MLPKTIFKLFLIVILVIGTLNFVYANGSPTIGPNEAKISVQNYLDSNNLPYIAVTPGDDDWQLKVNDTKTGEIKWISQSVAEADALSWNRYHILTGQNESCDGWEVHVNDKNGKNVGRIYVDGQTGDVVTPIITTNVVANQVPQDTSDNTTGVMLAVVSILTIAGAVGYWFKIRK